MTKWPFFCVSRQFSACETQGRSSRKGSAWGALRLFTAYVEAMTQSHGPGLTQQQGILLTIEVESAVNLLRDGRETLRTMTYSSRGADAVWSLLSLGVEKLLKLSIGVAVLEQTGEWPGKVLKSFGHDVEALDEAVRELMATNVDKGAQPAYSARALAALNADAIWPALREGLNNYGSGGRYHHLDWLTKEPPYDSPRGYWDAMEREVIEQQPHLLSLFASLNPGAFQEARRRTNEAIIGSLDVWQVAVYTFWLQGAFGAEARVQSSTVNPKGVFAR